MYLPKHFAEERLDVLHAAMAAHPLALLVTHGAGGLDANPVPWMAKPTCSVADKAEPGAVTTGASFIGFTLIVVRAAALSKAPS